MSIECGRGDSRENGCTSIQMEINATNFSKANGDQIIPEDTTNIRQDEKLITHDTEMTEHQRTDISTQQHGDIGKHEMDQENINEFGMGEDFTDSDPFLVWAAIRPWAASNVSCWDFLCDKAKWAEYPFHCDKTGKHPLKSQTYKIQVPKASLSFEGIFKF